MWSNTVCSHPKKGEKSLSGAERRLKEEMGFTCPLEEKLHFIYKVELANGLTEHEFDRVFVGYYEGKLVPNPKEVMDYKWISREALTKEMEEFPQQYTEWFKIMLQEFSL
jgi:isopentenyl-diphosphate delta-isomerase